MQPLLPRVAPAVPMMAAPAPQGWTQTCATAQATCQAENFKSEMTRSPLKIRTKQRKALLHYC